jgi:hypothetical protein
LRTSRGEPRELEELEEHVRELWEPNPGFGNTRALACQVDHSNTAVLPGEAQPGQWPAHVMVFVISSAVMEWALQELHFQKV